MHNWPKYAAEGSRRYNIPAKGQFEVIESEVKSEPYGFEIAFSSALDPKQDFRSLVSVPGGGKLSFIVNENVLKIVPTVKAEEKQFVSVSKGISSKKGQKLLLERLREAIVSDICTFISGKYEGVSYPEEPYYSINGCLDIDSYMAIWVGYYDIFSDDEDILDEYTDPEEETDD